jgi:outer membrane protein assembly factor BamA
MFGQRHTYSVQVVCADKPIDFFQKKFSYHLMVKDSAEAVQEITSLLGKVRNEGYLASSVDSVQADSTHAVAYIYIGEKFETITLQNGNVEDGLLGDANVRNQVNGKKEMEIAAAQNVSTKIIRVAENSGYPFATTRLDSFTNTPTGYAARIYIDKHELFRFDSLRLVSPTKAKRRFLMSYLGIRTNRPYDESRVSRINQRLAELQFVDVLKPHTIEFLNEKANINLFLKDKKASQFYFIIGFLPGSSGKKLLVTGEAKLNLLSPFGMGEELSLEWNQLQPKTQRLNVGLTFPYLLGLPLGISGKFDLYKRDTTWIDINGDYGLQYQIIGSNYLKASYRQKRTIILNVDTGSLQLSKRLPTNLDVASNEFALEYFIQQFDYRFNPTSGYLFRASASGGIKKIIKNNTITQLLDEAKGTSFEYLYDTIKIRTFRFSAGLTIDKFWRLAKRHTIRTMLDGKYLFAQNIFENEKYRLGGNNSLRGFDEQSIFTPWYGMADIEYRFLLSKNSYFSAFFNAAMVQDTRPGKGPFDFPFGFGAGAALETKAGIFGITFALGRQLDNKISFKQAKIHFGYVNYF